ncbi:MAG TPA: hypothetical protein VE173_12695, partial [Longimicrobiales bacterium]|nr:hypothetical protein [Longimicrobiales bacterium]
LEGGEVLNDSQHRLERVWLALRTRRGLARGELGARALDLVAGWQARGWATVVDGAVRLTAEGWLVLDRLAVELDARVG